MAQTRHQQEEAAEKAKLPAGEYEKLCEKRAEQRKEAMAAVLKEEKRHEMEKFFSYVSKEIEVVILIVLFIFMYILCVYHYDLM